MTLQTYSKVRERQQTEDYINTSFREVINLKIALDQHSIVAITNPQGQITYANDKFCAISKYSREELLGQDHRMINSGFHGKEFFKRMWATISHGHVWKGEIRNRAKDGSYYWVDTTIVPFLDENGKPYQYVSIRTDISERKRAEAQIQKLNEELTGRVQERTAELEASLRELEAFSYSVSHDLRAPLRHISGYIGLLRKACGERLSPEASRYLDMITDSSERMTRLIDDLLHFSRVTRAEIRMSETDPNTLVEDVIRALGPDLERRNIVIEKSLLPQVNADISMLRQVFMNLLSNAIKYTRKKDPARIEIGWCADNENEITFFVSDNGVGFDMEFADKLFNVFQRLHGDEFDGTGIGLALVRRIICRHGGRTWAKARVNHGATFYFSLPHIQKK